jgi:hypothetical protein
MVRSTLASTSCVRAAPRPINAADLARDGGGTERVFGALGVLERLALIPERTNPNCGLVRLRLGTAVSR